MRFLLNLNWFCKYSRKGANYIFKRLFIRKKQNTQPGNVRLACRAVKLAKLAEIYNIPLSSGNAAELAGLISEIPDRELGAETSAIIGCPAGIIPLLAGFSGTCGNCPYFVCDNTKRKECALKIDPSIYHRIN